MEIFKDVPYAQGYKVSNKGRIISTKRKNPVYLKGTLDSYGYLVGAFYTPKGKIQFKFHRVVAQVFCDNPSNKLEVNHKDGNKLNNDSENLEWVTMAENMKHAAENDLLPRKGENHHFSYITEDTVRDIKRAIANNNGRPLTDIAKEYNVSKWVVWNINKGVTYKHINP